MRHTFLIAFLVFCACSSPRGHKVELPVVSADFYRKALRDVEEKYEKKPSDQLLRQKLYYYEKLGWPKEALDDLNTFLEKHGLDRKIVTLFLQYYLSNEQYEDLVNLLDKWEFYNGLDEELAQYRILSNVKAKGQEGTRELIQNYTSEFQSPESFEFAARQAVQIEDTVLMLDYLDELAIIDPNDRLIVQTYVPLLLEQGTYLRSYELLEQQTGNSNFDRDYLMAQALYHLDSLEKAKRLLKRYDNPEAHLQLTRWYQAERVFDSSVYFVDRLILEDTTRDRLFLKAEILDERGWFNSSYAILSDLIKMDSTDSIARNKAEIVARKIAYLRNLKEKESAIPIPELKPKRLIE